MIKKIFIVIGTRPEAIKMAPLVSACKKEKAFQTLLITTGQHRHILDQVIDIFNIKSDFDLNIMKKNQTLYYLSRRILVEMGRLISMERPDLVLVHGDTTTASMTSLAAFYEKVKIGHVEAGLRSQNKFDPYPEEINRRMTDILADTYFAPTELCKFNLIHENIPDHKIFVTGNTVIDAVKYLDNKRTLKNMLDSFYDKKIILTTVHRRENWGKRLSIICDSLIKISKTYNDVIIVLPVHPNPNVRRVVYDRLRSISRIILLNPLPYPDLLSILKKSFCVLTDSGGIQEEAPFFGKPVLIMRDVTERPEAINAGTARLVGSNLDSILQNISDLINDNDSYMKMSRKLNLFGDGKASKRIVDAIKYHFNISKSRPEDFKFCS